MKLIKFVKQINFFKNGHEKLVLSDWKQLAQALSYKEFEAGAKIYDMFDPAKNLYVIMSGSVILKEKNPKIQNWDWIMKVNRGLQTWYHK